jgi:hypothetical protein
MSPAHRRPHCRVDGCKRHATFEVLMPRILSTETQVQHVETFDLLVCREHAEKLGKVTEVSPDGYDGYVDVDVERAAGWRLVVEFTVKPDANPFVLYEPVPERIPEACTCIPTPSGAEAGLDMRDPRVPRVPRVPGDVPCPVHGGVPWPGAE